MHPYLYKIPLKDFVIAKKGIKPKVLFSDSFEGDTPYLDISAFESDVFKEFTYKELGATCTENDVVVVWDGSRSGLPFKGKFGALGSTLMALTPVCIKTDYLYYFLKANYEFVNQNAIGAGIPHVNSDLFFSLLLPYTDENRQIEIVKKIEERLLENAALLANQKKLITQTLEGEEISIRASDEIFSSIGKFRDAIFEKAFNGELTKSWREKRKVSKTTWQRNTLSSLSKYITSGSRGWSKYYSESGARFIRTQDIKENYIDTSNMIFVALPDNVEGTRARVEKGDLLLTIVGSNTGKCAVVDANFKEVGYVNQNLALIRLNNEINPYFLQHFLLSPHGIAQINQYASGDAQPAINLQEVGAIEILLPTLDEQNEVVTLLHDYLDVVKDISRNYEETVEKVRLLERSIIFEAFDLEETAEDAIVSKASVLSMINDQKKVLEGKIRKDNKSHSTARKKKETQVTEKKQLIEILSERVSVTTEDLWKNSKYIDLHDVEGFYLELSVLKKEGQISTNFIDDTNTHTMINFIVDAN